MGRLTLNVPLSFGQYGRLTGERIRDKFLASRKKGLWMGGWPSLAYDIQDRRLVVNEPGATLAATSSAASPPSAGRRCSAPS